MDRRQFIKFSAATSATATLAGCGNPELHLARFIPEEELIPGIAAWKPSICPLCEAGCGIVVKVMQGEAEVVRKGQTGLIKMGLAKKLEGNPAHPISQGKLCARGQAAIQLTYHPDRITHPLQRTGERGKAQFKEITWEAALAELKSQLDKLAESGAQKSLAFLTRPLRGQRQTLISQFVTGFGGGQAVEFETVSNDVLRQANARSFGHEQLPTIDLARSRYVISFGADFLGTWNSPVSQNVGFGEMRQGQPGQRGKFVQVEPRMTQTGANADEWVALKPGTEGALALGIAHAMMKMPGFKAAPAAAKAGSFVDGWFAGLTAYSPEAVEKITGVKADRIERIALEFSRNAPAVALIGGAPLAHSNALFNALAVNALNALSGAVGQPGGIMFAPQFGGAGRSPARVPFQKLASDLLAATQAPVQVLLLYEANPVYGAPPAWRAREALAKIPYIVSFGGFIDETSALADLILPDHSFLESWVDHTPETGAAVAVASLAAPAMRPLHQTRAMPDVLLEVSRTLAKPLNPALPAKYEDILKNAFTAIVPAKPDGDVWNEVQTQGGWWGENPARPATSSAAAAATPAAPSAAKALAFSEPQFDGAPAEYPFHFLPYVSQQFLDGSLAHLPWLQELPDVLSTAMWTSWIEINPQTAAKLGINLGDLVEVTSSQGKLQSPAVLSPGIAPDVIAMPLGQGHENFTRYASGRGANPISILAPVSDPESGAFAWAATRVKINKVGADGRLILFAGGMRENEREHR
jgi:menaquinone reductase, molybdopterin-binding-like subunit